MTRLISGKASLADLETALEDWGSYHSYWLHRDAWWEWTRTEGKVMPYAGGYYDQPARLMRDFNRWSTVRRWIEIDDEPPTGTNVSPRDGQKANL